MNPKIYNKIIADPNIMVGKPIIKGTRITVELILQFLAKGQTVKEILTNYPHLTKEDIYAAIEYAREILEGETVYPLNGKVYAKAQTFAR